MIYKFEDKEPTISDSAIIFPQTTLIGDVRIGDYSSIWFGAVLRGDINYISIGKSTNIQDNCTIHVAYNELAVKIGDFVTVGHNAVIHACTIGNYSLIGMNATILDGAVVGDYCLVAAGAVVSPGKVLKSGFMYAGIPAKEIRPLKPDEKAALEKSAEDYYLLANKFDIN